ncbi:MAG: efflux RND transporter periplasmic adaptor subunit [Planctomycetes bacterium]|nr:efflux RND transporter periplasmic adaptor subunit [Planctomycetota bacterium]
MKARTPIYVVITVLAVGVAFWLGRASGSHRHATPAADTAESEAATPTLWTCPMHPEVRLPDKVPCPKCGMELVPVDPNAKDPGPRRIALSPSAVALARIETAPAERRFVSMPLRVVGKVAFDETRVRTIASRVAGRLERLFVDYTGISVKEGDHLVSLYSADLLTAQQELIEAKKRFDRTPDDVSEFIADSNRRGYESAREKLLLWGLAEDQVDAITQRGTAEDRMLIRSPTEGVVIDKPLHEGDYVAEGTPIYRIADLDRVWVLLDVYEQDLPWIRYGQSVAITAEGVPGRVLEGWVSFVSPVLDEKTRTVRVRVNVDNRARQLKPGMFVRAVVSARLGIGGAVLEPRLAGKWISPMHPEIVKDEPGTCDVCGMDLVPAESLGYLAEGSAEKPLVVPASAVLVTGTRGVVYVEVPYEAEPTYEGREVVLGPRAGDWYVIRDGLEENERVVVNGAFRVDSSMQILAKPSMMSVRPERETFHGPEFAAFRNALEPLYVAYLELQVALGEDDFERGLTSIAELGARVEEVEADTLPRRALERWSEESQILRTETEAGVRVATIAELRERFHPIPRSVLALERIFGHAADTKRYEAFCPMAFDDRGASWMQGDARILNPYFGAEMLRCGEVQREFEPVDGTSEDGK